MCLLAVAPRRSAIPRNHLVNSYDHNSDGFGIMFAKAGRVVSIKKKGTMEDFWPLWEGVPDNRSVAVHFRFGTSGGKSDETCHPFAVLTHEEHGRDLYLMHNGVLRSPFNGTKEKSDTMQYVEKLRTILVANPDALRIPALVEMIERDIGSNKFVLLEGNGRWHYLNKEEGKVHPSGVWYSNDYSLEPVFSGYGKGKAANSSLFSYGRYGGMSGWSDDGFYTQAAADYTQADWFMESGNPATWWKPQAKGFRRMKRVEGKMVPDVGPGDYKKDFAALPQGAFRVRIKDVAGFVDGSVPMVHSVVGGENVVSPETRDAATRHGINLKTDAGLCMETNQPCTEGCNYVCRGVPLITSHDGRAMGTLAEVGMTNEQRADEFAMHAEMIEEARVKEADEEAEREASYVSQLWSENALSQLTEDEMIEQIEDDPENAAIALGFALNLSWAYAAKDVS